MTLKKFNIFIFFILFQSTISIWAQEIDVSAKLDSNSIEVGDQVYLILKVEQNKDEIVKFPLISDTIINEIDVIKKLPIDTSIINERLVLTKKILITSFTDSIFNIPPFYFINNMDTLETNSLLFSVKMVKIDSAQFSKIDTSEMLRIFGLKEPINTPLTFKEFIKLYYPYIIGGVLLIALAILAYIYYKKRKENKPLIKISKPKEAPHKIAFRKLKKIKEKKLWQQAKEKKYYIEITDTIRNYIEDRFNISALESTSYELISMFENSNILDNTQLEELKHLLTLADLVKFAKHKPLPNENEMCYTNAMSFVENTIPKKLEVSE